LLKQTLLLIVYFTVLTIYMAWSTYSGNTLYAWYLYYVEIILMEMLKLIVNKYI